MNRIRFIICRNARAKVNYTHVILAFVSNDNTEKIAHFETDTIISILSHITQGGQGTQAWVRTVNVVI